MRFNTSGIITKSKQIVSVATEEGADRIREKLFVLAQAGAEVMYNDLRASLRSALKNGSYYKTTGNLERSLYQKRRDEMSRASGGNGAYYAVSYAGWRGTTPTGKGASQHAHLVEFGHKMPYMIVRSKNSPSGWTTAVRKGAKRPSGKDARYWSQQERDMYFIKRNGGEKQVAGVQWFTPVLREGSPSQKRAQDAIEKKFRELFA